MRQLLRASLLIGALLAPMGAVLAQTIPGSAARVNGVDISNFRLERHFEDYLKGKNRNLTAMIDPKVYKKLKREALDQLIEQEVLWQAAQVGGVIAADEELQGALKQFAAQFKTPEAYQRKLEHGGFDAKSYGEYVRREISGAMYLRQQSQTVPPASEDEIAGFYRENLHRFESPETLRARHILLKVAADATPAEREAAKARITALLQEVRGGADFAGLAKRHSEDRSAAAGGDLGEFARGRMVRPFEDALLALRPGATSDVVETRVGYHIIKLESRTAASTLSLDDARDKIRERLLAERRTQLARDVVAKLLANARIDILIGLD